MPDQPPHPLSTPRGVLAHALTSRGFDGEKFADSIMKLLEETGYVIMPRDPTSAMTEHLSYTSGEWSRRNYAAAVRAAAETISS